VYSAKDFEFACNWKGDKRPATRLLISRIEVHEFGVDVDVVTEVAVVVDHE
jgi:hypothetical protein